MLIKQDMSLDMIHLQKVLLKLTNDSYLFNNINNKVIFKLLKDGIINIVKFKPGQILIHEGESDRRFFYLLLKGELIIEANKKLIAHLDKMSLIGEIGFINQNIKRTATVKSFQESYLIKFDSLFLESISLEDKAQIYLNIAKELSERLAKSDEIIAGKINCANDSHAESILSDSTINSVITILN